MNDKVVLSEASKRDFDRLYDFGAQFWSERKVEGYLRSLAQACFRLAEHPRKGRARDDVAAGVRSIVFREHVIYYRIGPDGLITIARIMHGREMTPRL